MPKKIFYIIFFVLLSLGIQSVSAQDWLWSLQVAGSENLATEAIKIDYENNILVLTELTGSVTIGNLNFVSQNNQKDMLLLKLDKYGNILWTVQIGNTNIEDPKSIYIDNNNNIYLTGSFGGNLVFGDITITSTDEKDAFLAKINKSGDIVWAKNMGQNSGIQKGRTITSDGTYLYVLGFYTESVLLSRSVDTLLQGTSHKNYFLVKYDMNGNFQNARRIYSSSNGILFPNMILLNNNIYLSGYFSDTLIYGNDTLLSINRTRDFIFMKIDLTGNLIWVNTYGGTENDEIWDMTTDGVDLYLAGYFKDTFNVGSTTITSNGNDDIFVGKFDQNGNVLWALSTGSNSDDRALGITSKNNKVTVTGLFSNSINWGNIITAYANTEPFLGTISSDGVFLSAKPITTSDIGTSRGYKIEEDGNNHSFLIGKFNSSAIAFNSNISLNNTNPGNSDGFIAKYGCFDGLTVNVTDAGCSGPSDGQISVSPNEGYGPFNYSWSNGATTATISGLSEGDYTVTVSDNTGCSAVDTAHVTYHPPVSVSVAQTQDILCNGDSTAQVVATAADGFTPYNYNWSNSETTDTISNLPAGDYTVTVSDQCGNTATQTITVTQPDSLDVSLTGNIYNFGGNCIAHVYASASGGTDPYSYEWFDLDGNSLGTDDNVWVWADNYYIIVVTDANGCVAGWYFYVPGCNKAININDYTNLEISELYPEADASFSFVDLPSNNNSGINNGGTVSRNNTENNIFSKDLANGLKALGIGPEINVYPNPADETINISLIFPYDANAQIILLNSIGQTVKIVGWSQTFSYEKIVDVNNLSTGIYYLMVKTDFGVFKKNISIVH